MIDWKEYLKPICDICKKEVEKLSFEMNWMNNEIHVFAFCHGDMDTCVLPRGFQLEHTLSRGTAFKTKQIEERKLLNET